MQSFLKPFPYWVLYYQTSKISALPTVPEEPWPSGVQALNRAHFVLTLTSANSEILSLTPANVPLYYHECGLTLEAVSPPAEYRALTAAGATITRTSAPAYAVMDFRISGWINYWVDRALTGLPSRVNGVMSDEFGEYGLSVGSGTPYGWLGYVVPDMTPDVWTFATPGLAQFDAAAINAASLARRLLLESGNRKFLLNCAYIPYAEAAGGGLFESYMHGGGNADSQYNSVYVVERDFHKLGAFGTIGNTILTLTETRANDNSLVTGWRVVLRNALANWLVGCDFCRQKNFFSFNPRNAHFFRPNWHSEYDLIERLGMPITDKYPFGGQYTWRKDFTYGSVVTNMLNAPVTLPSSVTGSMWGDGVVTSGVIAGRPFLSGWLMLR